MHVIGTAGHVDHGKSSLVQSLTGTNPDRWLEEQLRGMTLDLGFAELRFDDGTQAGIVDVPGHERFLHNMLAGAAGMDVLLLVIAADEGVRPQTAEHLAILQFLNVRKTMIVVTKSDLLGTDDLAFAIETIRESLHGTIAQSAPVFTVSNRTGAGVTELRQALHETLLELPPRDFAAPAYLPVDRVFTLPGHGTIITGTLMQGTIAQTDVLKLEPSGKTARIRGLQTFGKAQTTVRAGSRVAVNLAAVDVNEIARGEMLVATQFAPAGAFAVRFTPLADALPLLKRRNAVRAYIGSAEILGTLVLEDIPQSVRETAGRLLLNKATVAYPGSAFVVRRRSPKNVLGGGRIGDASAHDGPAEDSVTGAQAQVLEILRRSQTPLLTAEYIAREANLREEDVLQALTVLQEGGEVLAVARPLAFAARSNAQELLDRALRYMRAQQKAEPWSMGVTSLALSRALETGESALMRVLTAFADEGALAHRSGYFATSEFAPALNDEQRAFFEETVPADPENPFLPVPLEGVVRAVKQSRIAGIGKAFDTLLAKGALVKVNDDIYRGTQLAAIHARVQTFLLANGQMTMAQFRDLTGTSRKYAVPLLEWFDARGITVRSGDYRMLRGKQ